MILVSRADGWGRLMEVSWDSWLLNEAREKEYIDSVRCKLNGRTVDEALDPGRDESLGGGGGGCLSSFSVSWMYFSKSVWSAVLEASGSGSEITGAGAGSVTDIVAVLFCSALSAADVGG